MLFRGQKKCPQLMLLKNFEKFSMNSDTLNEKYLSYMEKYDNKPTKID